MDPNLIKIRDYNIKDIKAGNITKPVEQAKHYLSHILKGQELQQEFELQSFVDNIQSLVEE